MAKPLITLAKDGEMIDFTQAKLYRVVDALGQKIADCPHCQRRGWRRPLLDYRVRFVHAAIKQGDAVKSLDSCTMWERTEYRLRYGSDTLHPTYRHPGDEDMTVEEVRP